MGKDKKFLDAGKNVASSIFKKRNEYEESQKEEQVVIEEVVEEKKLISSNSFGGKLISDDAAKSAGVKIDEPAKAPAKAEAKVKKLTQKEIDENQQVENEKVDIFAGLMTMGGTLKPSLIKEEAPEEELKQEEEEEEEKDFSYDVTSQFYTKAIKPIDKDPKK